MAEQALHLVDKRGRTFEVTFGSRIPHAGKVLQTVWLRDGVARTLQPDQVAALDACRDKASWDGWEQLLASVE